MTNRVQTLRSNAPGARPAGRLPGELYVNWADMQLGVIDAANQPVDLIPIRYFSTLTSYAIGDHVVEGDNIYRALVDVAAGPFNPAQWIGNSAGDFVQRSGDTMLGDLILDHDPVVALEAATKGYVDGFLPLTGGTLSGDLTVNSTNLTIGNGATHGIVNVRSNNGSSNFLVGMKGTLPRWTAVLGDSVFESGANAGSNFTLDRYADTGTLIDTPFAINRATGVATFAALSAPQVIGDNRIINGDMRIDQRNNGAGSGAINVYTLDRWHYQASAAGVGIWQRGGGVSGLADFPYAWNFNSLIAHPIAAADFFLLAQPIEADMVGDFAWGGASAQPVTLSFWVDASIAGTFGGSIINNLGDRSYLFSYNIPTANVWTRIVVTIPGDVGGTWVMSGNGAALYVQFDLGAGANNRGPANVWGSNGFMGVTGSVSVVATNAATFHVTGVKLEIGSVATPFNRQSLAKSMADCQRYFLWIPYDMQFYATIANEIMRTSHMFLPMRATPTVGAIVPDPNTTQSSGNLATTTISPQSPYSVDLLMQATLASVATILTGYRASADAEL